jgi:hypothetical protein
VQNAKPAAEAVANSINAIYMAALSTAAGIERLGVSAADGPLSASSGALNRLISQRQV